MILLYVRWLRKSVDRPVLRDTAILIAAGGLGLLPAMQVFQGENDLFRAALQLAFHGRSDGGVGERAAGPAGRGNGASRRRSTQNSSSAAASSAASPSARAVDNTRR